VKEILRKYKMIFVLSVIGVSAPAQAQDLVFDFRHTLACLEVSEDKSDCIGRAAAICMEQTQGGGSTIGMGACLDAELQQWDRRLNAVYRPLRDWARVADSENSEGGFGAPSIADALVNMQRAWITFRDESCSFNRSLWMGGTGGGPATLDCMMVMTAEQTLRLEETAKGVCLLEGCAE